MKIERALMLVFFVVTTFGLSLMPASGESEIYEGHIFGFRHAGRDEVDQSYGAGFSMYSAAWPLLEEYPGRSFQSGLFGTWMHTYYDEPVPQDLIDEYGMARLYSCIEGGLGWWRDTEFPTTTPKFIMGGVELNFRGWANAPGSGRGRDWDNPRGLYGVAQLSPWLLFPPDGLNLKQGVSGELFGYGYLPLPLTEPKSVTSGEDVPTGNQCWTLFLNTANFKGPVAFFTPHFWSRVSADDPRLAGKFLDTRPSTANKPISMETQYIPAAQAADSDGDEYARIATTQFPVNEDGYSVLIHKASVYNKKALWDDVEAWFQGGDPADGQFNPEGTLVEEFHGGGFMGWSIEMNHDPTSSNFASEFVHPYVDDDDPFTFRYEWDKERVTETGTDSSSLIAMPEYYERIEDQWVAVDAGDVPVETGLHEVTFERPRNDRSPETYVTPEEPDSSWKDPGPAAGPFKAYPGDGSVVTYYWYRFADQPAMLNADLTAQERETVQERVEKLHRHWTKDREYLAPPAVGELAEIDPALIVTPPEGMEIGYVPIATKQEMQE